MLTDVSDPVLAPEDRKGSGSEPGTPSDLDLLVGTPDLNRRTLDPQECIHEAVASINVRLRRSGGAQVSMRK